MIKPKFDYIQLIGGSIPTFLEDLKKLINIYIVKNPNPNTEQD